MTATYKLEFSGFGEYECKFCKTLEIARKLFKDIKEKGFMGWNGRLNRRTHMTWNSYELSELIEGEYKVIHNGDF